MRSHKSSFFPWRPAGERLAPAREATSLWPAARAPALKRLEVLPPQPRRALAAVDVCDAVQAGHQDALLLGAKLNIRRGREEEGAAVAALEGLGDELFVRRHCARESRHNERLRRQLPARWACVAPALCRFQQSSLPCVLQVAQE